MPDSLSFPESDTVTLGEFRRARQEGEHQCVVCGLPVDRLGSMCPRCRRVEEEGW